MHVVPASDRALLVVFGDAMSESALRAVHALHAWLGEDPLPGVVDLHPAYTSILVRFDPWSTEPGQLARALTERASSLAGRPDPPVPTVSIPVEYGGEDGPDLDEVALATGLPANEVVSRHAGAHYEVAFLGFSPGFPYLTGLPESLAVPRRKTPRRLVAAGSVAIAGLQAGIYPLATPGGWNVIGRTAISLFDPHRDPPCFLAPGHRIRFVPARELR